LLWQRRAYLAKSAALGMVLSAILAFTTPKQYKSTVQLMPPDSPSVSLAGLLAMSGGGGQASAAGNLLGVRTANATYEGILDSRSLQDDIINRFDLLHVYHLKLYETTRQRLAARTTIEEDKRSGNLKITVMDNDPYRAHDIAGAYVDELNKLSAQVSTSSARRERIFLEDRLKSIKEDLDSASRDLSLFSSRNATMDVQAEGRTMLESVAKVQQELIATETELRGLEASYGQGNIRVQSAEARIGELRIQLKKLTGGNNENSNALDPGQLYPSVRKLPLLGTTYTDLYRRVALQEAVYEILTKQYEVAKVQEAKEIPSVKILDKPDFPEKKSYPPRLLIMIIGSVVFFMIGLVWVIGSAWYNGKSALNVKLIVESIIGDLRNDMARAKIRIHVAPAIK